MDRLISCAGPDGSFAGGVTGAGKQPGGRFLAQMNGFPDQAPPFVNGKKLGKLLGRDLPTGDPHPRQRPEVRAEPQPRR